MEIEEKEVSVLYSAQSIGAPPVNGRVHACARTSGSGTVDIDAGIHLNRQLQQWRFSIAMRSQNARLHMSVPLHIDVVVISSQLPAQRHVELSRGDREGDRSEGRAWPRPLLPSDNLKAGSDIRIYLHSCTPWPTCLAGSSSSRHSRPSSSACSSRAHPQPRSLSQRRTCVNPKPAYSHGVFSYADARPCHCLSVRLCPQLGTGESHSLASWARRRGPPCPPFGAQGAHLAATST